MEMCYNGTLVMPSNYSVVNDNEMAYVEGGGIYFSRSMVNGIVGSVISQGPAVVAAAVSAIKINIGIFTVKLGGFLSSLGVIGLAAAGSIGTYILSQAKTIAERMVTAAVKRKGVEFGIDYKWGIVPVISGKIR